ncbi:poly-gamma-glutamate biosynthesis protein PgsC/CapC [Streptomyces indicus]|uniref:Poly-gamma-glutamate biosynthesis protein PgsC/CapC n=1 Tax=Streptomyces indicus TaxID=417292 RepID=A0A1G9HZZ6_9ACTN|nr:poly-gamma-glutamate biosynthesis protein PgsC/CapC [Streptomyces indicus]SDL18541.1 poly-gamma-glutamate biosynthesis protein PgsC/CapC [Streptomyces indicus]
MPVVLAPEAAAVGIAVGLLLSLVCYLVTNLSPGGMITPGWLALAMDKDLRLALMVAGVTALTYVSSRVLQQLAILYGKRLFAAVVLCGVVLQTTVYVLMQQQYPMFFADQTLGYIVPGLIAYQLIRQPPRATLLTTGVVTFCVYGVIMVGGLLGMLPRA